MKNVILTTKVLTGIFLISTLSFVSSCQSEEEDQNLLTDWLIPPNEVRDGGPRKDGIPSIDKPKFVSPSQISYMKEDDLVLGYASGNDVRAYPHPILDWHEIVNDDINGDKIAVTYCPLTGTGIGWDRMINGVQTTFGVSGLLYNSNLLPYDRATDSYWSQIRLDCVHGELKGTQIKVLPLVETTWKTWKEMYPSSKVLSEDTGFNRSYGIYPYGNFKTNHERLLFPVSKMDSRLKNKERVHGIISNGKVKVYNISDFGSGINVIEDTFDNQSFIIVGSTDMNFVVSFERTLSAGAELQFQPVENAWPVLLKDNEGNEWDIFGRALSGPRSGSRLNPSTSFIGYWFSWAAFFSEIEIYK